MQSAEEFALELLFCKTQEGWQQRIEADRNATRLALLEEYIASVNAKAMRALEQDRLQYYREAFSEIRAKYTDQAGGGGT